jgi:hypothetical protein
MIVWDATMLGRSSITTRSTHENMVIYLFSDCGCRGGTAMLAFPKWRKEWLIRLSEGNIFVRDLWTFEQGLY